MPPSASKGSGASRVHRTDELAVTSPDAMPSVKGSLKNSMLEASGAMSGEAPKPSSVLSRKIRLCICFLFQFNAWIQSSDNYGIYSIDFIKRFTYSLTLLAYIVDGSAVRNPVKCCINVKDCFISKFVETYVEFVGKIIGSLIAYQTKANKAFKGEIKCFTLPRSKTQC
jgi:hypothetical protein